jgi:hypothetical protein
MVAGITYVWAFVVIKISFAVLYLRFLADSVYRMINITMIVVLSIQGIAQTAVVIFQCNPVEKSWLPATPGSCINMLTFYYVAVSLLIGPDHP